MKFFFQKTPLVLKAKKRNAEDSTSIFFDENKTVNEINSKILTVFYIVQIATSEQIRPSFLEISNCQEIASMKK